ncbi:carcinoembryonic antigen-related cell adhesion molecule 1-like [Trichomycterus rosablanca]|uniref:carcinoembryonic antigen-related cell adhesion molecule 1-like n=1 Tax=Trichomycterus rosablanca TaxID=2290929 RepID=UPI002F3571D3
MKMLQLQIVLLSLFGVPTDSSNWSVFYPERNICAVRGFSATLPCNYSYPQSGYKVVQMLWCLMNSISEWCEKPPYVYNSSSNVTSDFVYGGDDKSNCTLFIQNVKFNYSGFYKFRFITDDTAGKWTGHPGVNLTVSDLKVELIRLSGNGTLKPGDSLNLTCHVNCTHSSSQIVWSKNNQNLDRSGPVLQFSNLTVEDSGSYTCMWNSSMSSGSDTISIQVEGGNWAVFYPERNICAVRGFSATLPCYYSYPQSGYKVVQMLWCLMNSQFCENSLIVYNSSSKITPDFVYGGDDKSNCTLFIQNVKFNYSGEYRFKFITDVSDGKWSGHPGVTLTVSDLKVELIRLSGNGTLKLGDSLNLTCHVNCTHSSSQIVWSKNNQNLDRSGPVLHFPNLTVGDSGSYTCTWRTNVSSGSDTISIQVEGGSISSGESTLSRRSTYSDDEVMNL